MGATARSGVYLCCVANYDSARVEIFIDQGDYQKNRAIYNHLEQNRDAIEAAYGKACIGSAKTMLEPAKSTMRLKRSASKMRKTGQ